MDRIIHQGESEPINTKAPEIFTAPEAIPAIDGLSFAG